MCDFVSCFGGKAGAAGVGKRGGRPVCSICEKEPSHGNFPYCKGCKKDVHACKSDALSQGKEATYEKEAANGATFKQMILKFQAECASLGQGKKRNRFDWSRLESERYCDTHQRVGYRDVWMHYELFEQKMKEAKHWSPQKCMEKWLELQNDPARMALADHEGPEGSTLQLPIPVEKFMIHERQEGLRQANIYGTKQRNFKKDQIVPDMPEPPHNVGVDATMCDIGGLSQYDALLRMKTQSGMPSSSGAAGAGTMHSTMFGSSTAGSSRMTLGQSYESGLLSTPSASRKRSSEALGEGVAEGGMSNKKVKDTTRMRNKAFEKLSAIYQQQQLANEDIAKELRALPPTRRIRSCPKL